MSGEGGGGGKWEEYFVGTDYEHSINRLNSDRQKMLPEYCEFISATDQSVVLTQNFLVFYRECKRPKLCLWTEDVAKSH